MCRNKVQNECNEYDSSKATDKDNTRCANGNGIRSSLNKYSEQKSCSVKNQKQNNRSHWCLKHRNSRITSLDDNNQPILYSKFAFHRIILIVGLVLSTLNSRYCVSAAVSGEQRPRQNTQAPGESLKFANYI